LRFFGWTQPGGESKPAARFASVIGYASEEEFVAKKFELPGLFG
jgi:hypothetical protein